jgi:hypothetical protein
MGIFKTEPVRVLGWLTSVITLAAGIIAQVSSTWNTETGWFGLAGAALIAVSTELQRARVTPVAKLQQQEPWATPSAPTSTETLGH